MIDDRDKKGEYDVGYRKPPSSTRFQKGQRANPRGRPPGRRNEAPYEAVLGQMVPIREDGVERLVNAAEAFLLQLAKRGLANGAAAALALTPALKEAQAIQVRNDPVPITLFPVARGSVTAALELLRIGRKLDRNRESARMKLEPWIIEEALIRLGGRRLTLEEQDTVSKSLGHPRRCVGRTGGRCAESPSSPAAHSPSWREHPCKSRESLGREPASKLNAD